MGKGFAQAQVHTNHSTRAVICMHLCLCKTLSQDCPHGEIRHSSFVLVEPNFSCSPHCAIHKGDEVFSYLSKPKELKQEKGDCNYYSLLDSFKC